LLFPRPQLRTITTLPFVTSTGAYPDLLPRAATDDYVCGSPQEIRGSVVEKSLCGCFFLEKLSRSVASLEKE
jgi:hypothetical protein